MASISMTDTGLEITLKGWEKLLTYKGDIRIPTENIRGATEDPTFMNEGLVIRTRGAIGVPGLFSYGVFAKKGDRIFASWRRGQNVLVIELQGMKWNRLALGCDEAKELAGQINTHIHA